MENAWVIALAIISSTAALALLWFRPWEARSAKLQEKKVEAIEGAYEGLVKLEETLFPILQGMQGPPGEQVWNENTKVAFREAYQNLVQYYRYKRLYFDAETCRDLEQFLHRCQQAEADSSLWDKRLVDDPERRKAAQENEGPVRHEIDRLRLQLEKRFRSLLGVNGILQRFRRWFQKRIVPSLKDRWQRGQKRPGPSHPRSEATWRDELRAVEPPPKEKTNHTG